MKRFERQINLIGFGEASQKKLEQARVLVVGAGGLGCPALLYLAAAGIGTIGIIDGDTVALSNLNRQTLYSESDVGKLKAEVAGNYLSQKYKGLKVEMNSVYLTITNSIHLINSYDLIVDGSDNFQTRYMLNDACVLLKKPLVFGAVYQNEGQVAVFNRIDDKGISTNYRDIFPIQPLPDEIPNCNESGVLGVLPGIIGTMMASEAIKLIAGYGKVLSNKMLLYNLLTNSFFEIDITPNFSGESNCIKTLEDFYKTDYTLECKSAFGIQWDKALLKKKQSPHEVVLIDVRKPEEEPKPDGIDYLNIPFEELLNSTDALLPVKTIYIFCQSGIRSRKATVLLRDRLGHNNVFTIEGGILKLINR